MTVLQVSWPPSCEISEYDEKTQKMINRSDIYHILFQNPACINGSSYSKITSTKSPSFSMKTISASLTILTVLAPQSHDCSATWAGQHWHLHHFLHKHTDLHTHTTSRTLPTCDISLGSQMFPAPEAGEFVKLILL